jgi:hypothetical protein
MLVAAMVNWLPPVDVSKSSPMDQVTIRWNFVILQCYGFHIGMVRFGSVRFFKLFLRTENQTIGPVLGFW